MLDTTTLDRGYFNSVLREVEVFIENEVTLTVTVDWTEFFDAVSLHLWHVTRYQPSREEYSYDPATIDVQQVVEWNLGDGVAYYYFERDPRIHSKLFPGSPTDITDRQCQQTIHHGTSHWPWHLVSLEEGTRDRIVGLQMVQVYDIDPDHLDEHVLDDDDPISVWMPLPFLLYLHGTFVRCSRCDTVDWYQSQRHTECFEDVDGLFYTETCSNCEADIELSLLQQFVLGGDMIQPDRPSPGYSDSYQE